VEVGIIHQEHSRTTAHNAEHMEAYFGIRKECQRESGHVEAAMQITASVDVAKDIMDLDWYMQLGR